MKHDGSIALFQYWNRLRNGRPAPRRTEVEPADIKTLLADTFILEKDTRGEAVFRLAGTRLCAVYCRELKGFSFASLWRDKDQRLIARLIDGTFKSKSVVVISFEGVSRSGRAAEFELIVLPLDGGLENPRCMGAISVIAKPFWLGADPVVEAHVGNVRVVDPDKEPMFLKNRPAVQMPGSFAPPLAPSHTELRSSAMPTPQGRRIRHLLVLDGGRDE